MGLTISLNRISFLPPPVRNNIFYEIDTLGLDPPIFPLGRSPIFQKKILTQIYGPIIFFQSRPRREGGRRIQTFLKEGRGKIGGPKPSVSIS
jgi:hypothetical protein